MFYFNISSASFALFLKAPVLKKTGAADMSVLWGIWAACAALNTV